MNARETILAAVRGARPAPAQLPELGDAVRSWPLPAGDIASRFRSAAQAAGAHILECSRGALATTIAAGLPVDWRTVSLVPDVPSTLMPPEQPHAYATVDAFICEGTLGVAENGAIWLPATRLGCRAGAFLAQHLVIVLERQAIVERLHEAYARIDWASEEFGIFVAGPSKTADIEQAMVIGAHGPAALTIVLTSSSTA